MPEYNLSINFVALNFIAHMWFDNIVVEADTTEDQSGIAHDNVLVMSQKQQSLSSSSSLSVAWKLSENEI